MTFTLFNLFAIFYAFRSLQIARVVFRDWGTIKDESFTPPQKRLAEQASFFLAVPLAVFFHESAHALAVWLFGGRVAEFGYRVFWGYVVPEGTFSPAQNWFIALAGTLGSLLFGLALWLALRNNTSPTLRYFGLRAFRYQIFFSLIYYPVFTLLGFYGDWRTIYNFTTTPLLSGATAVFHALGLAGFFLADRRGWFEMAAFESAAQESELQTLRSEAAANPQNAQLQLQLIDAYRRSGSTKMAIRQAEAFLKMNPNSAEGYLQLAALHAQNKNQVPGKARENAAKALSLGLNKSAGAAYANQLLGQYSLGVNKLDEAASYFDQGLAAAKADGRPATIAQMSYLRAMTYRRKGQYEAAERDIQQAIELTRGDEHGQVMSLYLSELETIRSHAGWPKGPSPV